MGQWGHCASLSGSIGVCISFLSGKSEYVRRLAIQSERDSVIAKQRASLDTPSIAKLIAEGMDPIHATYVFIHHIASVFASNVSQLPEMRTFTEDYLKAEEQYLPSGPPMSPLTTSYFSSWAFFDHRIGNTTDTLASCLIDANDIFWINPDQLAALKKMNESRMGSTSIKAGTRALYGCGN